MSYFFRLWLHEAKRGASSLVLAIVGSVVCFGLFSRLGKTPEEQMLVPLILVLLLPVVWGVVGSYLSFSSEYNNKRDLLLRSLPCHAFYLVLAKFMWTATCSMILLFLIPIFAPVFYDSKMTKWLQLSSGWITYGVCWSFFSSLGMAAAILGRSSGKYVTLTSGAIILGLSVVWFLLATPAAGIETLGAWTLPMPIFIGVGVTPITFPIFSTGMLIGLLIVSSLVLERQDA